MWFSSPVSFASVSYFLDGVHISRLGRLFRSVARDTQTRAFIELNRNTKRCSWLGTGCRVVHAHRRPHPVLQRPSRRPPIARSPQQQLQRTTTTLTCGTMWKTCAVWPASAAQPADWPRLADASGSMEHAMPPKYALGPAGRGVSHLASRVSPLCFHTGVGRATCATCEGRLV